MSGIDATGQFPNSFMARAAKLGQSRFMSTDYPSLVRLPSQLNVSIATAAGLTVPAGTTSSPGTTVNSPPSYAIITAIGGPLYATYDGSTPSSTNYDVTVGAGGQLPVQGAAALAAIKVFGTTMSVSYWA